MTLSLKSPPVSLLWKLHQQPSCKSFKNKITLKSVKTKEEFEMVTDNTKHSYCKEKNKVTEPEV